MLKTLMQLGFIVVLTFCFFLSKNVVSPTFQLTNSPNVVTKGQYGTSLIIEVSYSHSGFEEWLNTLSAPYPLFLIDVAWMQRSEDLVALLIEKQIPVGLLGLNNDAYVNPRILEGELRLFKQTFEKPPLWFATKDDIISPTLLEQLFSSKVNALAPSLDYPVNPSQGAFVALRLHREVEIDFDEVTDYMKAIPFISIEENLFGYDISTKRYP